MAATLKASEAGLQKVDLARSKKAWNKYDKAWWQLAVSSEATLKRFWKREPINAETFKNICETVGIDDWEAIADSSLPEPEEKTDHAQNVLFTSYDRSTFTGRDDEIAQLSQALHNSKQLLVIHGLTGIGKTTLAECIAAEFANPKFYHRIDWSQGNGAQSFAQAALTVLEKLNDTTAQKLPDAEILPYLLRKLEQSPYWLQLDSLEYVLSPTDQGNSHFVDPAWLDFVTQILQSSRHRQLRLVLTSQVLPSDLSHHLLRYEALWHSLPLEGLNLDQRLDLFRHCGIHAQTPAEESHLCAIANFFAGHPLILKMIAADISAKPFNGNITKYWQDYYQPRQTQPDLKLHQSQEDRAKAWIRRSLQDLPDLPRQMLQRCAVFRRPVPDAFYLAMVSDLTAQPAPTLVTLLDRNLVETDFQSGQRILRQHNLIRSVAYDLLKADPPTWQAAERQAAHLWLHNYQPAPDAPNLEKVRGYLEAFDHYCEVGDWNAAKIILLDQQVGLQLQTWGKYRETLAPHHRLIGHLDASDEAACQKWLGNACYGLSNYSQAILHYQQSLNLARSIGDRQGEGKALGNLGNAYDSLGRYKEAIAHHQQCLTIAREIGDRQGEGIALGNLGNAYHSLGRYEEAIALYQQWLTIAREIGDRQGEGNALGNLGLAYNSLGLYEEAIAHHQQHLTIAREIGDRRGEGGALGSLGSAYHSMGRYEEAVALYQQWLTIAREIGDRLGEGTALGSLGFAYYSLGRYEEAIAHHQQHLTISREIGDRLGEGTALGHLGLAYHRLGKYKQANDHHQQCSTIAKEIGNRRGEGIGLVNMGATQLRMEQYSESLTNNQAALAIFREIGVREGQAHALKNLADLHHALGEIEIARDYCQQALALATELGIPLKAECHELLRQLEHVEGDNEI